MEAVFLGLPGEVPSRFQPNPGGACWEYQTAGWTVHPSPPRSVPAYSLFFIIVKQTPSPSHSQSELLLLLLLRPLVVGCGETFQFKWRNVAEFCPNYVSRPSWMSSSQSRDAEQEHPPPARPAPHVRDSKTKRCQPRRHGDQKYPPCPPPTTTTSVLVSLMPPLMPPPIQKEGEASPGGDDKAPAVVLHVCSDTSSRDGGRETRAEPGRGRGAAN